MDRIHFWHANCNLFICVENYFRNKGFFPFLNQDQRKIERGIMIESKQVWLFSKNNYKSLELKNRSEQFFTFYILSVSFFAIFYMWSEFIKTFSFVFITPPSPMVCQVSISYKFFLGTGVGFFAIVFYFLFSTLKRYEKPV